MRPPPAAAQHVRPQPSPAELAAQGEAPVKPEFLRTTSITRVHVGAVTGSLGTVAAASEVREAAVAATAVAAGEGERQRGVCQKSKKQAKKERSQQRLGTAELCNMFALGKCPFGESCRFNHDVAAYLRTKPAELPGSCPFGAAERCPYGITCRWASTHARLDELVQRHILDGKQQEQRQTAAGDEAAAVGSSNAAALERATAAAAAAGGPSKEEQEAAGEQPVAQGWWRWDGTVPMGVVELPNAEEPPSEPLNTLSKDLQHQLRKGTFSFEAADAVLAGMGIYYHRSSQGQKGGRGSVRGGRGQKHKGGRGGAAAVSPLAAGEEAPAAKRPKLEEDGTGGKCGAATPMAVDEAAKPAGDAGFVDSLGAPADAAAEAAGTGTGSMVGTGAATGSMNAAAAVAAAAASDKRDGETDSAAQPHPREKRTIDLRGKTILAPLTTVGNLPFRRLCKTLGADVTCGEMALATNLLQGQPSEWALLKRHASEDCFGVQLCGGFADSMARCAQLIEDTCSVDFVDINFGCPIDLVCGKGAGSACLLKPQRAQQIVRSMSSVLSCPLTFKMRKGYYDGQDIAHTLVPQAAGWGAAAVNLHGRTREQRYSKQADWPYIKRCVDAAEGTGLQVVGNGDVFSHEDHFRHLKECPGLATTYIARGALIKPWIFTEIKEQRHWDISAGERLDFFKRFCSFGLEHWGSDSRGVETTRRFLLEWLSFTHRYIPVGLLEVLPQRLNWRPPVFMGRSDLETLLASDHAADWVSISEMLLGPAPPGFAFSPKHKANSHARREATDLAVAAAAAEPAAAASSAAGGGRAPAEEEEEY